MGTALYRALKAANVPDDLAVAAAAEPFVTKADLAEFATKADLKIAIAELRAELRTGLAELRAEIKAMEIRLLTIMLPIILGAIGIATTIIIKWGR